MPRTDLFHNETLESRSEVARASCPPGLAPSRMRAQRNQLDPDALTVLSRRDKTIIAQHVSAGLLSTGPSGTVRQRYHVRKEMKNRMNQKRFVGLLFVILLSICMSAGAQDMTGTISLRFETELSNTLSPELLSLHFLQKLP